MTFFGAYCALRILVQRNPPLAARLACGDEDFLSMKSVFVLTLVAACAASVHADERIYRCGNEYTNTVTEAQAKTCKVVSGGNVTVIQMPKMAPAQRGTASRTDAADQRARDSDARLILESELKKAQAQKQDLLQQYNTGAPDRLGPETRNNQKYLDRVAELKASIDRTDSDIDGITREIQRLDAASPSGTSPTAAK